MKSINSQIDNLIRIVEAETEKAGRTLKIIEEFMKSGIERYYLLILCYYSKKDLSKAN
jgi:hypothetical protein